MQKVQPPAPLVFTPPKSHEESEMPANAAEEVSVEKVAAFEGSEEDSVVVYDDKRGNIEKLDQRKRRINEFECCVVTVSG